MECENGLQSPSVEFALTGRPSIVQVCFRRICPAFVGVPPLDALPSLESRSSIPMRGVAIAACAELAIQPAGDLLEEARGDAAVGLAQLLFLAGQPRHLDHATFALVGQVPVERVVGALEDHELAVQRFHLDRKSVVQGKSVDLGCCWESKNETYTS